MYTTTLLPFTRVVAYLPSGKRADKCFATFDDSRQFVADCASKGIGTNIYRIDKINGTWRTDWQLVPLAELDDEHEEFNQHFEQLRVASGPHLPLSL